MKKRDKYWSSVKSAGVFFALCFLLGCTVGPSYHVPFTEVPSQWKNDQNEQVNSAALIENWWEIFDDLFLNKMEEQAVSCNKELRAAFERFKRAKALAGIERGDLFPQLNLKPSFQDDGTFIQIFGLPPAPPGTPPYPTLIRVHEMIYSLPLNLDYKLDLWGKQESHYQSARKNAQAKVEAWRALLLSLTGDLASFYFQLRSLDSQIDILERTTFSYEEALKINRKRFNAGYVNFADVTRAETLLYNAQSDYNRAKQQRALKENAIAVLLGIPASDFSIEKSPLEKKPPMIPAGIPSTILLRRPDIREKERDAASEQALVKSAYANFFPDFSLTGALGFTSPDLADFLSWKSRLWSFAINAIQPIFRGGKDLSNLEAAKARFREASFLYQQQVIMAFQQVENALSNINYQFAEADWLEKSVVAAKETKRLSTMLYYRGRTNYLDVTASERSELQSELSLADLRGAQYVSTIQLIIALGGSWDVTGQTPYPILARQEASDTAADNEENNPSPLPESDEADEASQPA